MVTVCSGERQRIIKYMIENKSNGLQLEDSLITKEVEASVSDPCWPKSRAQVIVSATCSRRIESMVQL